MNRTVPISIALCCMILGLSCDDGSMTNQGRVKPYEPVKFFADGSSARPIPEGAVSRDAQFPGPIGNEFPFAIGGKDLARGRERYNIYCSVCHGYVGDGDGMVVRRGFTKPPSFHIERLRQVPPGHIVQVVTNGFGAMYSYSDRVNMDDRWRIAAYIRALQFSQHADPKALPPADQQEVQKLKQ
jgi:mono/diheme cytochrome c family protein